MFGLARTMCGFAQMAYAPGRRLNPSREWPDSMVSIFTQQRFEVNAASRARRESRLRTAVGVTGVLMFVASASFVACTSTPTAPVSAKTAAAAALTPQLVVVRRL
jgi:hypothetical protein